jgi:uncharacterized protein (UPF0212 family)
LAKCPKCGADVNRPVKAWKMKSTKAKGRPLLIGFFKCPKCDSKFRKAHVQKRR